jgi:hypothetical protein
VDAINRENSLTYHIDDIEFSDPVPTSDHTSDRNTLVTFYVMTQRPAKAKKLWYDRVPMYPLFNNTPIELQIPAQLCTVVEGEGYRIPGSAISEQMLAQYNFAIEPDEMNVPKTVVAKNTVDEFHVYLNDSSLGYTGSVVFHITVVDDNLEIVDNVLDAIPNYSGKPIYHLNHSLKSVGHHDLATVWLELENVNEGDLVNEDMLPFLTQLIGPWTITPNLTQDNNLYEAVVLKNTPWSISMGVQGIPGDRIIVIELSDWCSNWEGYIFIRIPKSLVESILNV